MTIPYNFDPLGSSNMPTYAPGTILIKHSGEYTYNIKLSRGVYKIALCGSGGTGTAWLASSYGFGSSGGSGAFVEIEIFNPRNQQLQIYAPPARINRGSQAGGGRPGGAGYGGSGGTYTVNSSSGLITILSTNGINGKGGGIDFSGSAPEGASVSLYDSWGTGREVNSNPGGLRVEYLRYS